jgi:hypothetical protein
MELAVTLYRNTAILVYVCFSLQNKASTYTLALPIDNMLYIYLLCPHFEHQKNPFQPNSLNAFTKKTGSNNVKLTKVGSNAIVPVPVGAGPNKERGST